MKQALWSIAALLAAAGLLAGMVAYTVAVMRAAQIRILTGEPTSIYQEYSSSEIAPSVFYRRFFFAICGKNGIFR